MTTLALGIERPRNKYLICAAIAARRRLEEKPQLLARAAFYALLLFIFSRIWAALGQPEDRIWYLAVGEWIALSVPRLFSEIERDVRSGDFSCSLTRPTPYLYLRLADAAGELAVSLGVFGATGVMTALALTHALPKDPRGLVPAALLGVLACVLWLLFSALIGLGAFFFDEASPVYWVFQKLAFLLGGLFVPLELYPDWLRTAALVSPFSAMLYGPATAAVVFSPWIALLLAVKLGASIFLVFAALEHAYRRALDKVLEGGGT